MVKACLVLLYKCTIDGMVQANLLINSSCPDLLSVRQLRFQGCLPAHFASEEHGCSET
jgi:hypothetical protein